MAPRNLPESRKHNGELSEALGDTLARGTFPLQLLRAAAVFFPALGGVVRNGAAGTYMWRGRMLRRDVASKITMTKYLPLYEWPEDPWPICKRRGCFGAQPA